MNPILTQIVLRTTLRNKKREEAGKAYSDYELARGLRELRITAIRLIKDALLLSAGIFSAAFGFKGFLLTNHFIDGGATGISLLISALTSIPLYQLIICVNLPFIVLAYRVMGKIFAIKTALAISGLALVLATVHFPDVTQDKLLVAVFGGFFLGAGVGFAVRGGAVIDGTEVLSIFLNRKLKITIGDIILIFNILIFSVVAYLLSVETALYSILTYLAASRTVNFIIEGIEEYTGITIVSHKSEEIRKMIIEQLGRGVTVYQGKRGFGTKGDNKAGMDIIYTVITRLEVTKLSTEIEKIDPEAFVVTSRVKDTKGGMIKKRPLNEGRERRKASK